MSSFGEKLRTAREAKGLTCSQVAAQTHMLVQIVEEMEREDFHRIPAPIYGRGFVRLFADCVGLDPVPLVREFMDIYEGRRTPAVSVREVPVDPIPPPVQPIWQTAPEPQAAPAEPPPVPDVPPAPEPVAPLPEEEPEPAGQFSEEPLEEEPEPAEQFPEPPPVERPAIQPAEEEPEPAVQIPEEPVMPPPVAPAPAVPAPDPIPETPRDVQGLELFEQMPARTFSDDQPLFGPAPTPAQQPAPRSPAGLPPQIDFDSSRFLTSTDFEDGTPTAAARFRKGLTDFSSSIVKKVRGIPRRVWRVTALALCAVLGLVFIVWSISKLYSATSTPDGTVSAETVRTPSAEQPGPVESAPAPSAPKAKPAPGQPKPGTLISTGQDIPNLIRD